MDKKGILLNVINGQRCYFCLIKIKDFQKVQARGSRWSVWWWRRNWGWSAIGIDEVEYARTSIQIWDSLKQNRWIKWNSLVACSC